MGDITEENIQSIQNELESMTRGGAERLYVRKVPSEEDAKWVISGSWDDLNPTKKDPVMQSLRYMREELVKQNNISEVGTVEVSNMTQFYGRAKFTVYLR